MINFPLVIESNGSNVADGFLEYCWLKCFFKIRSVPLLATSSYYLNFVFCGIIEFPSLSLKIHCCMMRPMPRGKGH